MFQWFIFLSILAHLNGVSIALRHEPHIHSEVKIVEYTGPFTKELLSLFKAVEDLELIDCNLTSVSGNVFSLLPNLKKMYTDNLTVTNVHEDAVKGQSNLEEFHYIHGNWDGAHLDIWNDFPNLKKLVISRDKTHHFAEIKTNSLNKTKLEYLEISKSCVKKLDDGAFNNLDKLETLVLSGNKLKSLNKEALAPLKNLKVLDLHDNLLETFETSHLPELPHLEKINLSKNPLKEMVLDGIDKIAPNLKEMKFVHTYMTEAQTEELRKIVKFEII